MDMGFCFSYINAIGWGFRVCVSLLSGLDQEVWSLRLLYVYVCLSFTWKCYSFLHIYVLVCNEALFRISSKQPQKQRIVFISWEGRIIATTEGQ